MSMIEYKALYRKYRPQTFAQVKGQDHIVQTLENIIKSQKISHGYLFSGPRGTGKTSVAKIFANTINCQEKISLLEPCSKCINNLEATIDIIEMDAASNNGVDEIRDLKEKSQNLPFNSHYKIYIIDEVHMLSKNAFNAFLKILEEPPKHVIFILATTDPQKLPLTILSRLQRFNFHKIANSVIEEQLISVLNNETITYEPKAIKTIAKLAAGGLRDALSMVDQVSIYGNGNVQEIALFEIFGITSNTNLIKICQLASQQKLKELLHFVKQLLDMGAEINLIAQGLFNILKDYIIYKKTRQEDLLELTDATDLLTLEIALSKAYQYLDIVVELIKELQYSQIPNQVLELSLIKLATNDQNLIENQRYDELELSVLSDPLDQKITDKKITFDENDKNAITSLDFKDVIFEEAVPSSVKEDAEIFDFLFAAKEETSEVKDLDQTLNNEPLEELQFDETSPNKEEVASEFEELEIVNPEEVVKEIGLPFADVEDLLPKRKHQKIVRETDPEKILDVKKISNHNMFESMAVNKELQAAIEHEKALELQKLADLEKERLAEEQKLQELVLNQQNANEGTLETVDKIDATKDINLSHYMTAEINLANSQGQLIKKDLYQLPQLINLFVIGKRTIQEANKQKWLRLESYQTSQKYYDYIAYLLNAKLIASGEDFILLSSEDNAVIWKINSFIKQDYFKELISKVIGHPIHVIAITKQFFHEAKEAWKALEVKPEGKALSPVVLKTKAQITEEYTKNLFK